MTPEFTFNDIKDHERLQRDPNYISLYYEMPVVLDYGDSTDEELEAAGEPRQQLATLLAHRKSKFINLAVFAHDKSFSQMIYKPGSAYSLLHKMGAWSHEEFCEHLQFRAAWSLGKPFQFIEDVGFDPVPEFSQRALEIWAIMEMNYIKTHGGGLVQ